MEWLIHNPIAEMSGPQFLVFGGAMLIVALGWYVVWHGPEGPAVAVDVARQHAGKRGAALGSPANRAARSARDRQAKRAAQASLFALGSGWIGDGGGAGGCGGCGGCGG